MVLGTLNLVTARTIRSDDEGGFFGGWVGQDFSWILRAVADTADIINGLHQEL